MNPFRFRIGQKGVGKDQRQSGEGANLIRRLRSVAAQQDFTDKKQVRQFIEENDIRDVATLNKMLTPAGGGMRAVRPAAGRTNLTHPLVVVKAL